MDIREHNIKPHADIEVDIMNKKEGRMTFTLRINGGNIVDFSLVEYVDMKKKYGRPREAGTIIIEEHTISRVS